MKLLLKILAALIGLVVVSQIIQIVASETGEVVVATTTAADGSTHDTRLWVVDHEGSAWLRAGGEASGWYQEMLVNPGIDLVRDGVQGTYTVQPDASQRDPINTLMRDKYAWRDAYVSFLFSRDDAIPIRLVPGPSAD